MPPFPALSPCGLLPLQLREVLNAGLRLPVDIPEIEELRLEVKRREWEDSARRSLGARQHNTLAFLSELVASAVEVGVESTPMAAGLRWGPQGAAVGGCWGVPRCVGIGQHCGGQCYWGFWVTCRIEGLIDALAPGQPPHLRQITGGCGLQYARTATSPVELLGLLLQGEGGAGRSLGGTGSRPAGAAIRWVLHVCDALAWGLRWGIACSALGLAPQAGCRASCVAPPADSLSARLPVCLPACLPAWLACRGIARG